MRIMPIIFDTNKSKSVSGLSKDNSANFSVQNNTRPLGFYPLYQTSFKGIEQLENNIIKKVVGKKFQGAGIYIQGKLGKTIDLKKLTYKNLCSEPLDITKATDNEITAHRFSLSLIETYAKNPDDSSEFATQWVNKYNPDNRCSPLAVSHSLNDFDTMEDVYTANLRILSDPSRCKSLDVPITDKKGNLCIDAVVFDTETTGTNPNADKIVQLGAMRLKNGQIVKGEEGTYNRLINPEIHIPEGASAVNGITDDMVEKAPPVGSIMKEFLEKFMNKQNGIIVAWNGVKFDIPLLNRTIRELREVNPNNTLFSEKQSFKVIDPQILIQRIHPFLGSSKKLSNQYHWMFCKPMEDAHDALADVKGTIPMLKYCLYWLSEQRTDKSKPLTLRKVLLFQNGAQNIPGLKPFLHPTENYNSNVKFNVSYKSEVLKLTNYFDGYNLDEKTIQALKDIIGESNVQKLKEKGIIGTKIDDVYKGHKLQAAETKKIPNTNKKVSLSYLMRENFRKVIGFAELESFNGKSKEEIENLILDNSKTYLKDLNKMMWIKDVNPDNIPIGNDLPNDKITRKVMSEMI